MKADEYRQMTIEELQNALRENREAHFSLRIQSVTGQLEDHNQLRFRRREIARVLTVLSEKEREREAARNVSEKSG